MAGAGGAVSSEEMNADVITLIAQHGGTLGLAVFAIWMLNRVWELRLEEAKRYADELHQVQQEVREALDRNTEAWTRMMERAGVRSDNADYRFYK